MSTDELLGEKETDTQHSESEATRFQRFRASAGRLFSISPRYFLVALVVLAVGWSVPSFIPLIPALPAGYLGLFVVAFALGGLTSESRYLETAVAAAVVTFLSIFTQRLIIAIAGVNITKFAAIGGAVGGLLAVVGYYFGRDLRDGLTRDIGE